MTRSHALTERLKDDLAERALAMIGLANLVFVALFFTLFHLATPARAAETCAGDDLLAQLAVNNPDALAEAEAKAAAVANGEGRFWRVSKAGIADSYLFGTMHVTDSRALTLPEAADAALAGADRLVIETTDVLDQAKASAAMLARPDLMMFTDGQSLDQLIPPADKDEVERLLADKGMPLGAVRLMKPWMLLAMIALPDCESARKAGGGEILDIDLARRATAAGKPVEGLESMVEQLDAMASLPMDNHIAGMVDTLKLGDRIDDVFETMLSLYAEGRIGMIMPGIAAALEAEGDEAAYAEFEEKMILIRNRTMAERAEQALAKGNSFIAVGALHLPGEDGLVELLRRDGWTVTRAD